MANDDAASPKGQSDNQASGANSSKSAKPASSQKGASGAKSSARSGNPAKAAQAQSAPKAKATATDRRTPVKLDSPRWLAPAMIACFVLGILWIAVWYIAPEAPLFKDLDFWNVVIGFGFIMVGFGLSTRWR